MTKGEMGEEERYFVCNTPRVTTSRCENTVYTSICVCACVLCSIILFIKAFSRLLAYAYILSSSAMCSDGVF